MKQQYFISPFILLLACFGSCSLDGPETQLAGNDEMPVHFNLDFANIAGIPTRSLAADYQFSDGKSISTLKGYVYNQSLGKNELPIKVVDIDIKEVNERRGGEITIMLPKNQTFDIVFFGSSIEQNDPGSKLYYNGSERTLSINYNEVKCNDEELDCFFATATGVTTESVQEETIELKRPFAQLNIGTQDYDKYNASTPVKDIAVTVDEIYNKIDLMTGEVVGEPISVNFIGSSIPSEQIFPVSGYSYLSMNYLLVGLRKLINIGFTVNHNNSTTPAKTVNIKNVAVERNYQTNVYGKTLLTQDILNE